MSLLADKMKIHEEGYDPWISFAFYLLTPSFFPVRMSDLAVGTDMQRR
jgi:hypothetical protein